MTPRHDFHIHTKYLGCANETMEVQPVIDAWRAAGVTCMGFTDHLNRADQLTSHRRILADIRAAATDIPVHFGVELNFTGPDEGFVWSPDIKGEYGFQYAIGGIHSTYLEQFDAGKVIEIQHRHHLAVCANGLVDALVHPWWFSTHEFRQKGFPDFGTVGRVPEKLTRELAAAAVETDTAIEINGGANIQGRSEDYRSAYLDYLSILAEEGVTFLLASDAHAIGHAGWLTLAWEMAEKLHLPEDRFWRPSSRPIAGD
ncbi:MAG TPA: PHP domain-containing protein [Phycisphaerae bacterium]|nr:PHP domain-containing protein [Phycisphaerae bacterium]HUU23090.1 PHP domain-containing protein [Phycisphaerae bacterium]